MLAFNLSGKAQCTELLWADEFDGTALDTTKWNIEVDGDGGGNNELQFYTNRDTNIFVNNGTLKIRALKENYELHEYTSGRVHSQYKGDWKYGRIEAKIKLPEGKGIWPAFWMLPTENTYGTWPNSGEIDIVELVGGGSGDSTIYGTLHVGPPWNFSNGSYKLENEKFSDNFHVFAIEWSEETINWYVDDILYSSKSTVDVSTWLPFQERFHVILNLAVGGNWPGAPDETTLFPQIMEVDYVRVYGDPTDQGIVAIDSAYPMAHSCRYVFSQVPEAEFVWSVNEPSASIISGSNSNEVVVHWGCISGEVELTVNFPTCGSYNYKLPVNFSTPSILGPDLVMQNEENIIFTVPQIDSSLFTWFLPQGSNIIGEAESNIVSIIWGCVGGEIGVQISNACGMSQVSKTVNLIEPALVGPTTVVANSTNVSYSMTALPGASYSWSVPQGAVIEEGQNTSSILLNVAETAGALKVVYENNCGVDSLMLWIEITDTLLLCDYESSFLVFEGWDDGVEPSYMENPNKDLVNPSDNVGVTFKAKSPWSGLYADLDLI
jgi:beta-glucanase (GH16 family)